MPLGGSRVGARPAANSAPNHRAQRNALFSLTSCWRAMTHAYRATTHLTPLALRLRAEGDHGEPYPLKIAAAFKGRLIGS